MQARVVATEFLLFIYLRTTYMLAFLCRIHFNPYFTELYISLFIWLKHPLLLQIQVIPGFIRIISYLLPNYNLSEWHAHCCFWVAFQHKSRISPLDVPLIPPSHQLHASSCTQPCMHARFYFLNRVSFVPKCREIHVFSQDSYTPSFLPEYSHPVFLTPSNLTQTLVWHLS